MLIALNPRVTVRLADYQGQEIEIIYGEANERKQLLCDSSLIPSWLLAHTGQGLTKEESIELCASLMKINHSDSSSLQEQCITQGLLLPSINRVPPTNNEQNWLDWGWRDALDFHLSSRNLPFEHGDDIGMSNQHSKLLEWEKESLNGESAVSPGPYKEYLNAPVVELETSSALINQMSFGEVLVRRRTTRKFNQVEIKFKEFSELLLHTCGKVAEIDSKGVGLQLLKTSPSGGARHPVEAYVVAFNVEGIDSGIYHYNCKNHSLEHLDSDPDASLIWEYVHRQGDLVNASMAVFFTARWARHMWKYRYARSYRMVMFDVGHLVQTFILTATALGLRTFLTPAVSDHSIQKLLHIDDDLEESPLYCVAIG